MISELRLFNERYLINDGLYGTCDGIVQSPDPGETAAKIDIIFPSTVSNNEQFPVYTNTENTDGDRYFLIMVKFPNGLYTEFDTLNVDFYVMVNDNEKKKVNSESFTIDILYLPEDYMGYFFVDLSSTSKKMISVSGDSRFSNSLYTLSSTTGVPPSTPVELTYWPQFLVSTHKFIPFASEIAAWAGAEFYDESLNLSSNFNFDTNLVEYYAISIYGYKGGNRYFQFNDLYISDNSTANTCKVHVYLTNMRSSSTKLNVDSTISILWARHIKQGIIE